MRGHLDSLRAILSSRQSRLTATLIVCLTALGTQKTYEHLNRRSAEHILDSVVAIEDAKGRIIGGGAVINDGRYIITVNHVVDHFVRSKKPLIVRYRNGETAHAEIIRRNKNFDIALLKLQRRRYGGLRIKDDKQVRIGAKVRAFGHPFGIPWLISDGIVSKKSYFPPNEDGRMFVIWTTAWIEQGNSGGPLVSEDGEIIGLVMAFMNPRSPILGAQHINLCVSGSEILRFLEN
jgi:S1-C subfamily serine protease